MTTFAATSPFRRARVLVDEGNLRPGRDIEYLGIPEPFRFQEREDNLTYTARGKDNLFHIATVFYRDPRLWWVLADYQPIPIDNAFAPLEQGRQIVGPSPDVLQREILSA